MNLCLDLHLQRAVCTIAKMAVASRAVAMVEITEARIIDVKQEGHASLVIWVGEDVSWVGEDVSWEEEGISWVGGDVSWVEEGVSWVGEGVRWVGQPGDRSLLPVAAKCVGCTRLKFSNLYYVSLWEGGYMHACTKGCVSCIIIIAFMHTPLGSVMTHDFNMYVSYFMSYPIWRCVCQIPFGGDMVNQQKPHKLQVAKPGFGALRVTHQQIKPSMMKAAAACGHGGTK